MNDSSFIYLLTYALNEWYIQCHIYSEHTVPPHLKDVVHTLRIHEQKHTFQIFDPACRSLLSMTMAVSLHKCYSYQLVQ